VSFNFCGDRTLPLRGCQLLKPSTLDPRMNTLHSCLQDALGTDGADNVSVNFFGDGTANNGAQPANLLVSGPNSVSH